VVAACEALSVSRSSFYRWRRAAASSRSVRRLRPSPPRALDREERLAVRQILNSERFQDLAPRQVFAALLDEGEYWCHWRTMYRMLAEHDEVRERRNQLRHPAYEKPELLATGPNQVWSWDITRLLGPVKWTYYYLYVILDIFSRYVVGWMLASREAASLAKELIGQTCVKQHIRREQLYLHSDRGSPMIARSLAMLLADLGVTKSHSRPHVSDDNPYSEAQFKTLKYRPDYPERFGCDADARAWARSFFHWYNDEHYHSALGLLTPADVHYGRAEQILHKRQRVLQAAYEKNPERFVKGAPKPLEVPHAVWINPPRREVQEAREAAPEVHRTHPVSITAQNEQAVLFPEQSSAEIAQTEVMDTRVRA
jgi:putative transposase